MAQEQGNRIIACGLGVLAMAGLLTVDASGAVPVAALYERRSLVEPLGAPLLVTHRATAIDRRYTGCLALGDTPTNTPSRPPEKPLLLGDEKPLLLDDDTGTNAPTGGADNSRCQVCHINFMQEPLVVAHARTNIGCATCHGACDAHIADESWASGGNGTAPDIMFPRLKIYAACIACHKPEQVFVKVEKHKPFWWSIAYQERVCTDCHGQHHMVTRRCRWK